MNWWRGISVGPLRIFLRLAPNERHRVFLLTVLTGGVCGLVAVAFHSTIRFLNHRLFQESLERPTAESFVWWVVIPTLGALVAGILLEFVVPNARGSGVPQVKFVYAVKSGRLRLRDALGKFVVGSIQLGTGSALGREGPTVQICAGFASMMGRVFALSPANVRRLIPVGAAAGIAAAFNAPIAAVTFTIEEIVGDLDQTVLSGVVVAAALAAAVEHSVLGEHPVFDVPGSYRLEHPTSLLVYALLGIAASLIAHVFYLMLLSLRARLRQVNVVSQAVVPSLGGFATGVIAVLLFLALGATGVLGDGYVTLSAALVGRLSIEVLLALVVAKLLATVLCYSAGGAGGIFAPVLFIGGMLGGAFGHLDQWLLVHPDTQLGSFALVGMGALFAAVIRAPITSVLIIFEMTRGYGLILPLMIANAVAYILARSMHPVPIYEALLAQDGIRLPQMQRAALALSAFTVADTMTTELVCLSATETAGAALERVAEHDYSVYPIVGSDGRLLGLISEARLSRNVAEGRSDVRLETEARPDNYLRGELRLVDAVAKMTSLGARQMAVVEGDSGRLVGMLAMSDVMRAHSQAAAGGDLEGGPTTRAAVSWRPRSSAQMPAQRDGSGRPPS